jgi:hypothetical protein
MAAAIIRHLQSALAEMEKLSVELVTSDDRFAETQEAAE